MDEQGSHGPRRRPDDDRHGDERARDADQEYFWEGRPGEDFGPMAPPGPLPGSGGRRPDPPLPLDPTTRIETPATRSTDRWPATGRAPLRPDGIFTPRDRRRRAWGPLVAILAAIVALGGLAAVAMVVISGQSLPWLTQPTPTVAAPAGPTPPGPAIASPASASPVVGGTPRPAGASPAPAASPTPLTIAAPSTPTTRPSPATSPTVRPAPAIMPTPPALVTPPGLRFPTSTPARIGASPVSRTPPAIPTARLPTITTRVWSEQVIHKVGDDASICAQTSQGATAQLLVIAPDRTPSTLGEFPTPADKVCYTLRVDQPDLWVLTLIIRDADAKEIDRQSAALWVSR